MQPIGKPDGDRARLPVVLAVVDPLQGRTVEDQRGKGEVEPSRCQWIADKLNRRPRKRLGFRTPEEVYAS